MPSVCIRQGSIVKELIDALKEYDENTKIYFSSSIILQPWLIVKSDSNITNRGAGIILTVTDDEWIS